MEAAIKTGLLFYAVGPGPKQRRFWCLSPQTKAINPQCWQRGSRHEQDINKKKQGESKEVQGEEEVGSWMVRCYRVLDMT